MKKLLITTAIFFLAAACNKQVTQVQRSQNHPTSALQQAQPSSQQQTQPVDETVNWKIYTNSKYGFEIKYPANSPTPDDAMIDSFSRGGIPIGPNMLLRVNLIKAGSKCHDSLGYALELFSNGMAGVEDQGNFVISDSQADARLLNWTTGGTAGGEVVVSKKSCDVNQARFFVDMYDPEFSNHSTSQHQQYFEMVKTFKFTK